MAELIHSAQNFMNAEDAIIAKKRKRAERMEANPMRHSEQAPHLKKRRTKDKNKPRWQEGWSFSTESTIHATEHAAQASPYVNQGRSFLEMAGENEGRPQ